MLKKNLIISFVGSMSVITPSLIGIPVIRVFAIPVLYMPSQAIHLASSANVTAAASPIIREIPTGISKSYSAALSDLMKQLALEKKTNSNELNSSAKNPPRRVTSSVRSRAKSAPSKTTKKSLKAARGKALTQLQRPDRLKNLLLLAKKDTWRSSIKGRLSPYSPISEYHPYLKFVWTGKPGKELELHLFLRFINKGGRKKTDITFASYKKKYQAGLKKYYDKVHITKHAGDWNNANVNFTTKLVIHTKTGEASHNLKQKYIRVEIGGNNDWFTTVPDVWYGTRSTTTIRLPYKSHIKASMRSNFSRLASLSAHETGHALGLNDAYSIGKGRYTIDRMAENSETTRDTRKTVKSGAKYANLMKNDWEAKSIISNDLEMIIASYNNAFTGRKGSNDILESYRTYSYGKAWPISKVISNRSDKNKE